MIHLRDSLPPAHSKPISKWKCMPNFQVVKHQRQLGKIMMMWVFVWNYAMNNLFVCRHTFSSFHPDWTNNNGMCECYEYKYVLVCEFERFACACVSREKWERESERADGHHAHTNLTWCWHYTVKCWNFVSDSDEGNKMANVSYF